MSEDIKITIETILKDEKFQAGVKNMTKSLDDHKNKSGSFFSSMKVGWLALVAVVFQVGKALQGMINEAMVAEKNMAMLTQALKNQGTYSKELVNAYKEQATALQKLTKFGDDEIIKAQAQLTMYGIQKDRMLEVTQATLDFAEAKGIDLKQATEIVGKSIGTENNMLGRYGVVMDEATKKTDRTTAAVKALNAAFGGQAQKAAQTFQGRVIQLKNNFSDFQEAMGKGILIGLNPMIEKMQKFINSAGGMEKIDKVAKVVASAFVILGNIIGIIANNITGVISMSVDGISSVIEAGKKVFFDGDFKGAADSLASGFVKVKSTYQETAVGIVDSFKSMGKGLKDVWTDADTLHDKAVGSMIDKNDDLIKSNKDVKKSMDLFKLQSDISEFVSDEMTKELRAAQEEYEDLLERSAEATEITEEQLTQLTEAYNKKRDAIRKKYNDAELKRAEEIKKIREEFAQTTTDAIIEGITKEELAGKKASANFVKAIGTQVAGILSGRAAAALALGFTPPPLGGPQFLTSAAVLTGAAATVKAVANGAASAIESFDVGTPSVQGDQVAQIHNGERIIPAAMNIPNMSNESFMAATYRGLGSMAGNTTQSNVSHDNSVHVNLGGIQLDAGRDTTIGDILNMADRMGIRSIFQRG